jgi:glycine hydroxymethyltransferase
MEGSVTDRQWLGEEARAFHAAHAPRLAALSTDELDAELHRLVAAQAGHADDDCLVLYAGTNAPNPRLAALAGSSIGSRPNLGHPGAKHNRGMDAGSQLELLAQEAMCRLFRCRYAELRVGSGSLANLYVYMATAGPGDRVLAFSDAAAGHPTHHAEGAAGLYGLDVHDLPYDGAQMDVDLPRLAVAARELRPKLIIVGGSMCLHPYDVRGVRAVADEVGAHVLYDAAHMGGLIAGGRFQQPLAEGAHAITGSTYKSFGGPPSGMILTDDEALAERLDAIAFPGLTANFDLGRQAALALAALDLLEHGAAYADGMIANAQALAAALAERGVAVLEVPGKGATSSQHVAVPTSDPHGDARRLEAANVLVSEIGVPSGGALRLGTQELTRRGLEPEGTAAIAEVMARVLVRGEAPAAVRPATIALRRQLGPALRFVRAEDGRLEREHGV